MNLRSIVRHRKVEELYELAQQLNIPLTNLALGWCLKNDNVSTVILGASKTEQLSQNLNTLNYMEIINEDIMGEVEKIFAKLIYDFFKVCNLLFSFILFMYYEI